MIGEVPHAEPDHGDTAPGNLEVQLIQTPLFVAEVKRSVGEFNVLSLSVFTFEFLSADYAVVPASIL
jgi:hypothetical protein